MGTQSVKDGLKGQAPPQGGETTTVQVVKAFPKMLEMYEAEVSRALPAHLRANIGRYTRLALSEFRQNEKLALCDPRSVFASVILASQMGWELGGTLGHAYLVPYGKEAQLIPGWKGLVDLAHRSGRSEVWTGAVYQGDDFEFVLGARPDVKHIPRGEDDPAKLTHTYSIGWIKEMPHPIVEVWPVLKLTRHRDRYNKVGRGHYSFNNWEMYARKVPLLQVVKYLPVSVEMSTALSLDSAHDMGESQGVTISSAAEGAIFPSPFVDVKPEGSQEPEGGGQPTGAANAEPPKTAGKVETKTAPPPPAKTVATPPAKAAAKAAPPPPAKTAPASAPAPQAAPAPAPTPAPPAAQTAPGQPPAWTQETPAQEATPAPAPAEPPATATDPVVEVAAPAAPAAERKRSKNPVIRKIKLPEFIDRISPEDTPTDEQIQTARNETDRLNVNLEKTVIDWTGAALSEINTETLLVLTEILTNYKPAGK